MSVLGGSIQSERSREELLSLLTAQTREHIDHWRAKFPEERRRSAVIQSLMAAQEQNDGWLSGDLITAVAHYLDVPPAWAYEAASFYSLFHLEPVGRHKISVCDNISCMLCGADEILAHIEKKLGIKRGATTPDGRITLVQEEECLAACVRAPMMIIDGHYYENLTIERVDQLLDELE